MVFLLVNECLLFQDNKYLPNNIFINHFFNIDWHQPKYQATYWSCCTEIVICMLILCISVCIVITKYTWSNTDNYCQHEPAKCIKLYCLDKMYNCTFYKITVQKLIDNQWSLRCYIWSDLMSIQYQPLITINTENELENLMVE